MGDIQEFQAIILAGVGSRLSVLTEDLDKVPKALLPVANKPMLHYQLQWLESAKITNIIVLAQNSARQKINEFLYKTYELSSRQTKIELICLDEAEGSADSLRHIKDKIKFDFIVLSSDLIIDIPAHTVLDTFRALRSTVTVLFSESSKAERSEGRGNKDEDTSDYVGINHKKARLLYMAPKVDVDDDTFLSLHMALIKKFPVINFHTHLRDAHLYIFNRWVMDLIYSKKHISSLKADLLPLLIECQYNKNLYEREGIDQFQPQSQSMTTAYLCSTTGTPDGMTIPPFMRTNTVSEHSSPNQLYRGMIGMNYSYDVLTKR
ncbi:hypothetical protein HK099_004464 [Clydaea vesicula]|uniref:Translation initiation factor eIF2B subunit gamma n=1 Tax=Clydaea vesicula TaxID=447962 RepID=A0AAD5U082_9FUNG|nr:hypothetical protein HK099_004464 [Clydaea vesicula]KAJ3397733.1 hypothetical protein HDU92_004149 [Lobulomyces angularis]